MSILNFKDFHVLNNNPGGCVHRVLHCPHKSSFICWLNHTDIRAAHNLEVSSLVACSSLAGHCCLLCSGDLLHLEQVLWGFCCGWGCLGGVPLVGFPLGQLRDFYGCFTRVSTTHSVQKSVLRKVCCLLIDSDSLAVLIALSKSKSRFNYSFSDRAALWNPTAIQLCIISFCSAP